MIMVSVVRQNSYVGKNAVNSYISHILEVREENLIIQQRRLGVEV